MLNHDWPVIIDASRHLLEECRSFGHLLVQLPDGPTRTQLWIAESVQRRLRGPASAAQFRFTRDIRTNQSNIRVEHNADVIWTIYAGREDVRLAALRLWRFYADLIIPLLFGPQTTFKVVNEDDGSITFEPQYPPVRSDEEWTSDAITLIQRLLSDASEFEAAIASLEELLREETDHATGMAPSSTTVAAYSGLTADSDQADLTVTSYFPNDLHKEMEVSPNTFNKYALAAGVQIPKTGDGNHRYSDAERLKVVRQFAETSTVKKQRERAKSLLQSSKKPQ